MSINEVMHITSPLYKYVPSPFQLC